MNKDYLPSTKYTDEELDHLDISYYFRDSCVNHLYEHIQCTQTRSFLTNNPVYDLFNYKTSCKKKRKTWLRCQKQRESEIEAKMADYLRIKGQR